MLYSKYGSYISDEFLLPYNSKLYCCDLNILSIDAMGRFFPDAGIFNHFIKKVFRVRSSYNDEFLHPKNGVNYYIKRMTRKIQPESLRVNTEIIKIDLEGKKAQFNDGTIVKYNNLISTIPLVKLFTLCNISFDSAIYSYSKVLVFNFGFNEKCTTDLHWVYYPESDYIFYRIGYWSNIYEDKRLSIYVEIAFKDDANNIDISEVRKKVLDDLKKAGVVKQGEVIDEHKVFINPAYVHIRDDAKLDTLNKLNFLSNKHNVYSIGRYGAWKYCSIEDNILEAMKLAERI